MAERMTPEFVNILRNALKQSGLGIDGFVRAVEAALTGEPPRRAKREVPDTIAQAAHLSELETITMSDLQGRAVRREGLSSKQVGLLLNLQERTIRALTGGDA